jgi:hypothetical protein
MMAGTVLLHVTIDHGLIIAWARRHGARPSTFEGDERPWPLFFDFGAANSGLVEIGWDKFFAEFERADLAFLYRDAGPDGKPDDFHEFIKRTAVLELTMSGKSTIIERAI